MCFRRDQSYWGTLQLHREMGVNCGAASATDGAFSI